MTPQPERTFVRRAVVHALSTAAVLALGQSDVPGQDQGKGQATTGKDINAAFAHPDVKAFVKRFESDDREVYARRESIVKALHLKPGMAVADLGAGTGIFTRLFARSVGTEGKVYAVDVSPAFLTHIEAESKRLGQTQVHTIRGTQDGTGLAPGSVDLIFLCDVYHHLEQPSKTLGSVREALRPGGQLVLVEFDRGKAREGTFVKSHVRADMTTFINEVQAAGFDPVETPDAPELKENFFQRFVKRSKAQATSDAASEK